MFRDINLAIILIFAVLQLWLSSTYAWLETGSFYY